MSASRSVRISDAERSSAMEALGIAFSEGRLDVVEYDARCRGVAEACFLTDLDPFFADLPEDLRLRAEHSTQHAGPTNWGTDRTRSGEVLQRASSSASHTPVVYTAGEIAEAYQSGRNARLGVFSLSVVGSLASSILMESVSDSSLWFNLLWVIPVVWIMLYIMKVGPQSWYVPSPRRLQKQRSQQLKIEDKVQRLELRAKRRAQGEELTDAIVKYSRDAVRRRQGNDSTSSL